MRSIAQNDGVSAGQFSSYRLCLPSVPARQRCNAGRLHQRAAALAERPTARHGPRGKDGGWDGSPEKSTPTCAQALGGSMPFFRGSRDPFLLGHFIITLSSGPRVLRGAALAPTAHAPWLWPVLKQSGSLLSRVQARIEVDLAHPADRHLATVAHLCYDGIVRGNRYRCCSLPMLTSAASC